MDQITHEVRGAQWLEIVTQCQNRPEGTTVKQWLSENGLKMVLKTKLIITGFVSSENKRMPK